MGKISGRDCEQVEEAFLSGIEAPLPEVSLAGKGSEMGFLFPNLSLFLWKMGGNSPSWLPLGLGGSDQNQK